MVIVDTRTLVVGIGAGRHLRIEIETENTTRTAADTGPGNRGGLIRVAILSWEQELGGWWAI